MRPRSWTDDELRAAVRASTRLVDVLAALGLSKGGATLKAVRNRILVLGLDISHFARQPGSPAWDPDPGGSQYVVIKRTIAENAIDTSHFTGRGWARGQRNPVRYYRRPLSEILVRDSDYLTTADLRRRLIKEGLKDHRCEECGRTTWRGAPVPLQLDHINGDRTDNRLQNLRVLCSNCHAQTDTYCGRNIGRRSQSG